MSLEARKRQIERLKELDLRLKGKEWPEFTTSEIECIIQCELLNTLAETKKILEHINEKGQKGAILILKKDWDKFWKFLD